MEMKGASKGASEVCIANSGFELGLRNFHALASSGGELGLQIHPVQSFECCPAAPNCNDWRRHFILNLTTLWAAPRQACCPNPLCQNPPP